MGGCLRGGGGLWWTGLGGDGGLGGEGILEGDGGLGEEGSLEGEGPLRVGDGLGVGSALGVECKGSIVLEGCSTFFMLASEVIKPSGEGSSE